MENVTCPAVDMDCAPSNGTVNATVSIASIALNADGSFGTTQTTGGTVGGNPATFHDDVRGVFHGEDSHGLARAAGSMVESVTYTASGTSYTCSSNPLSWYATA